MKRESNKTLCPSLLALDYHLRFLTLLSSLVLAGLLLGTHLRIPDWPGSEHLCISSTCFALRALP